VRIQPAIGVDAGVEYQAYLRRVIQESENEIPSQTRKSFGAVLILVSIFSIDIF